MQPRLSHVEMSSPATATSTTPTGQPFRPLTHNLQREASIQGFHPAFGRPTLSPELQAEKDANSAAAATTNANSSNTSPGESRASQKISTVYNLDSPNTDSHTNTMSESEHADDVESSNWKAGFI